LVALLVYVSAYHLMYTTTALKAEAFLTASIMAASYYWLRFDAHGRLKHLLLGAMFSGMAVMTKGVFTLITISSGLVCMWLYQGRWRELLRWKWWVAALLTVVCVTPELWALYRQFDMHPEKTVFGQTAVSGIRFFLWDSQFGRFFNVGPITNKDGNKLFFVLVFLWAFLPWVAAFVLACWRACRPASQEHPQRFVQVYLLGGFFVSFVMFSLTSFQLDYYTVIVYPFAAVLCAPSLLQASSNRLAVGMRRTQLVMAGLTLCLALALSIKIGHSLLLLMSLASVVLATVYAWHQRRHWQGMAVLVLPVICVNLLYLVLEGMTLIAHTRYSIPHNITPAMASQPDLPVVVYQLDPPVAYETGLYRQTSPVWRVEQPEDLPPLGAAYFLVCRTAQVAELAHRIGTITTVIAGDWVDHKTGTLPRQIELAAGRAPLENFSVYKVVPRQ
jgi:4-amino-4-deoxy-L-arabinose transferase-like glycosyltransferase